MMNGLSGHHSNLCSTLALFLGIAGISAAHSQTYTVSIPSLDINQNERIVGFEIEVRSARIATLPNAPIGWNVKIDNDPSWNTSINASVEVGAAALEGGFFKKFLRIEQSPDKKARIELQGDVIVTSDFISQRKIKLRTTDFGLAHWVQIGPP